MTRQLKHNFIKQHILACPNYLFYLTLIVLVSLVLWVYWPTLYSPFQYDDNAAIVTNTALQDLGELWKILSYGHPPRPVLSFSLALNYYWGGLNPYSYHWINLLLHIGSGLWVRMIIVNIAMRANWQHKAAQQLAWITALFFLLQPLQSESVSYIWGRSGLLCGFFYLGAFALYLHQGKIQRVTFSISVIFFALALGTKAIALSLPFLLWWTERYLSGNTSFTKKKEYRYLLAPFLILAGLRLLFYAFSSKINSGDSISSLMRLARPWPDELNVWTNLLTQAEAFFAYLKLLIWPLELNVDHDFEIVRSLQEPLAIMAILALISFFIVAWLLRQRAPLWSFALIWYLATLAFFFLLPLRDTLVERRLYLPVFGFCLFTALLLMSLIQYLKRRYPGAGHILWLPVVLVAVFYSSLTLQRNAVWSSNISLWQDSVTKSPNKPRPHGNLAVANLRRGETQKAINTALTAIRLDPYYGQAWTTLLDANLANADHTGLQQVFSEAFKYVPAHSLSWYLRRSDYLPPQFWQKLFLQQQKKASQSADQLVALALFHLKTSDDLKTALHLLNRAWSDRQSLQHFRRKPLRKLRKALQKKLQKNSHLKSQI